MAADGLGERLGGPPALLPEASRRNVIWAAGCLAFLSAGWRPFRRADGQPAAVASFRSCERPELLVSRWAVLS